MTHRRETEGPASTAERDERFEVLKRVERLLRWQITNFSARDNLPRDELYRRGTDDLGRTKDK